MLKIKRFGDLRVGDTVWKTNTEEWRIIPLEVVKIEDVKFSYIRIYLQQGNCNFMVYGNSCNYDPLRIYSDYEMAENELKDKQEYMEQYLINKIDRLIIQYENLQKWKKEKGL